VLDDEPVDDHRVIELPARPVAVPRDDTDDIDDIDDDADAETGTDVSQDVPVPVRRRGGVIIPIGARR
jgi:hypothetical protein